MKENELIHETINANIFYRKVNWGGTIRNWIINIWLYY